jgi:hypothetical protein
MASMKIQFGSIDPQARGLRLHTVDRVRSALGRLRGLVARVKVSLADTNGPLPGVDKRCELQAVLPGGQVARIEATSRTWSDAVNLATTRLRGLVVSQMRRMPGMHPPAVAPARQPSAWRGQLSRASR